MSLDLVSRIKEFNTELACVHSSGLNPVKRVHLHGLLYDMGYRFPEEKGYKGADVLKREHSPEGVDFFGFHPIFSESLTPNYEKGSSYIYFPTRAEYHAFSEKYIALREKQERRDMLKSQVEKLNRSDRFTLLCALGGIVLGGVLSLLVDDYSKKTVITVGGAVGGFLLGEHLIGRRMRRYNHEWSDLFRKCTDEVLALEQQYEHSVMRKREAISKALYLV